MENLTNRVTTKEAARILGVTDGRVRQMILKGQLPAKKFGRALTLSRRDVERHRTRKVGRPKKERSAKPISRSKIGKPRSRTLDEVIAESGIGSWTDADFKRAAKIGEGLFDGFTEEVRRWRDQNEILEAERWARLRL
jgi:excisionase family DNA binding protein